MCRIVFQNVHKIEKTPPYASSKSWAVYESGGKKMLWSKLPNLKREIASLTKIMVLYTWIKLCKRFKLDPEDELVEIPQKATKIVGTSARLRKDDILSVIHLYYALMLPSGNDAGFALALFFGEKLLAENVLRDDEEDGIKYKDIKSTFTWCPRVSAFLKEMNFYANKLGMVNTIYDSPHGLSNQFNLSTSEDQCLLISHCFSEPLFSEVVNTQNYTCKTSKKVYLWENTNKLLQKGFWGVKTGITESAGPWLAIAKHRKILGKDITLILVLLGWKTQDDRWKEAVKLMKWCFKKVNEQFLKN